MGRQALKYSAILIGGYLALAYATGGGKLLKDGSAGAVNLVKAFQARS